MTYAPAPIGFAAHSSGPISVYASRGITSPAERVRAKGKPAHGSPSSNSTVRGSTTRIDSISSTSVLAADAVAGSACSSMVNFTSSAVSGSPLEKVTPSLSVRVHTVLSSFGSRDSASLGSNSAVSGFQRMSRSKTAADWAPPRSP